MAKHNWSPAELELNRQRMAARWADPAERVKMLKAAAEGCRKAAELKRKRMPIPADPAEYRTFRKVSRLIGNTAARKAFGLLPSHGEGQ